jgi:hypothetical protein
MQRTRTAALDRLYQWRRIQPDHRDSGSDPDSERRGLRNSDPSI